MADGVGAVRAHVVPQLPVGEPDAGVAVVAGVQGPRGGRGQVADVAAAQAVAGRQGAGRDTEHAGGGQQRGRRRRRRRRRGRAAAVPGLRGARGVEAVRDTHVLLRAAGGHRRVHHTVLRGQLPGDRGLDGGQQPGVRGRGAAAAGDERHRVRGHTAPEPAHHGRVVGRAHGRVDGRVRRVRVGVRRAAGGRAAARLGAAGVHTVQRVRQHDGRGAAAVDDDRRAVPAPGARHHGRRGAVARVPVHLRHRQGVARADDGAGHGQDHVAVRGRGGRGRRLRVRVPAGDARQEPPSDREDVQQRRRRGRGRGRRRRRLRRRRWPRKRGHRQEHRVPGEELRARLQRLGGVLRQRRGGRPRRRRML